MFLKDILYYIPKSFYCDKFKVATEVFWNKFEIEEAKGTRDPKIKRRWPSACFGKK